MLVRVRIITAARHADADHSPEDEDEDEDENREKTELRRAGDETIRANT